MKREAHHKLQRQPAATLIQSLWRLGATRELAATRELGATREGGRGTVDRRGRTVSSVALSEYCTLFYPAVL